MEGKITVTVAIDAMGGDNAPGEIVKGAVDALSRTSDLRIKLVGVKARINACLRDFVFPGDRLEIINADDIISGHDDPGMAIRRKKSSSMVIALKTVSGGEADAFLSAGNTGALMAGGVLFMGRIPGVSRPALLANLPVFRGEPSIVLDVGANMDAAPEELLQYAFMGLVYAREVLNRKDPSVAMLNVGTEDNKGNSKTKLAYLLLKEHIPSFIGNVEGTQVFGGVADIIICDGFVGNIFLKSTEAIFREIFLALKNDFSKTFKNKIGGNLIYGSLQDIYKKIDSSNFGGAPLIGVNGVCVKCHGSSRAESISNAIIQTVYPLVNKQVPEVVEEILADMNCTIKNLKGDNN